MSLFFVFLLKKGNPDVKISLPKTIKVGVGSLWSIKFHERALRHIKKQIRKNLKQNKLLLSSILNFIRKH